MADFAFKERNGIQIGYFPALEEMGFVHGFTCRIGGESDICPGTLNMALHVGDDPEKVVRNREKVAAAMGFSLDQAVTCAQVHGNRVAVVTEKEAGRGARELASTLPDTDGLVTNTKELPLMLFYADCVPVMLADTDSGAVGLVHAGWRGSVGHIVEKGIALMEKQYGSHPEHVTAAIGPSIGACCYEVDRRVLEQASGLEACFHPTWKDHYQLDLWEMNRQELLAAGVPDNQILMARVCTSCHHDLYFSYRAEHGHTGRMAAIIYKK
jgi:YfiH family protein